MTVQWVGAWLEATRRSVQTERLFGERWDACRHVCVWQPPTDVYENEDDLVVRVEVAGMCSNDFSIMLMGQELVISGTRFDRSPKHTFHQMEIRFGEFRVVVHLPWRVGQEDVEAKYEDGFLTVRLPRTARQRVPVVEAQPKED